MKKAVLIFAVILLVSVAAGCGGSSEDYVRDGNTKMMTKDYDEAIKLYQKALELDDSNVEAIYNIGRALYLKGDRIQACEYFAKVKRNDPKSEFARKSQVMLEKIWAELEKEGKLNNTTGGRTK